MTNISISHHDAIFRPLTGPAIVWYRLRLWLAARREKINQKLLADRLQELKLRDPGLYADLPANSGDLPPPRSALPLIPHAVVAGFFMEEQR